MAQVKDASGLQNVTPTDLPRRVSIFLQAMVDQINGGIDFKFNLRSSSLLIFNFTAANSDLTIAHDLDGIPKGFIVVNTTVPARVYAGSAGWTDKNITLRSDAVGTVQAYAI